MRKLFAALLLVLVSCSSDPSKSQQVVFTSADLTGSSALIAVIKRADDGTVKVVDFAGFESKDDITLSGRVKDDPTQLIVMLGFTIDLDGRVPKFIPSGESTDGFLGLSPSDVYYATVNGTEDPKIPSPGDSNSALIEEFIQMVYVEDDGTIGLEDNDSDGFQSNEDCNDEDEAIYPDASELFDGKDNNCDGSIDEGWAPAIVATSDPSSSADLLDDGIITPADLSTVWLSDGSTELVEFIFAVPVTMSAVDIWWGYVSGTPQTAQEVRINASADGITYGPTLETLSWAPPTAEPNVSTATFAPTLVKKLKITFSLTHNPGVEQQYYVSEINYTLNW